MHAPRAHTAARRLRLALAGVVCALALIAVACQPTPAAEPLPVLGEAPRFTLVDQGGEPFSSESLEGRVALFDFIYTHCTDACPILSANMAQVQKRLKDQGLFGSRVMLVSLSVNPLHDTPRALAEYGQRFGVDGTGWKLLTGEWEDVFEVVADFKVGVRTPRPPPDTPAPGGTEIAHSTRVVLVDGDGQVREYLRGTETSPDEVVAAVRRVLR